MGVARLDFLSGLRNCPIARLDFLRIRSRFLRGAVRRSMHACGQLCMLGAQVVLTVPAGACRGGRRGYSDPAQATTAIGTKGSIGSSNIHSRGASAQALAGGWRITSDIADGRLRVAKSSAGTEMAHRRNNNAWRRSTECDEMGSRQLSRLKFIRKFPQLQQHASYGDGLE